MMRSIEPYVMPLWFYVVACRCNLDIAIGTKAHKIQTSGFLNYLPLIK